MSEPTERNPYSNPNMSKNDAPQSPQSGYGIPAGYPQGQPVPPPPSTPPAGGPPEPQNGYNQQPHAQGFQQPQNGPQNPYNQSQQAQYAPVPRPPWDFTVAYAFLYFLGMFGGHKFYLGQTTHGVMYLGAWLAAAVLSFVGIGFLVFLGLILFIYADLRTLPEQTARSNTGEQFQVSHLGEFFKKGFGQK